MSSWLMTPILLIAAQTLPTREASAACVEARQAQQPACASSRAGACSSIPTAFVCGLPQTAAARNKNRVVEGDHVSDRLRWGQQKGRRCRPRSREVQATMDVDGPPDVAGGDGKRSVVVREEVLRQQKEGGTAATTVEFPNIQAPTNLPQPGEWLQQQQQQQLGGLPPTAVAPLNSRVPSSGLNDDDDGDRNSNKKKVKKADPFAAPDNEYTDSFVDSLWINLLSSRMSAAVEAEAAAAAAVVVRTKGNSDNDGRSAIAAAAAPDVSSGAGGSGGGDDSAGSLAGEPALAAAGTGGDATVLGGEKAGRGGAGAANGGGGNGGVAVSTALAGPGRAAPAAVPAPPRRGPGSGGMGGGYTYEDYVALATGLQAGAPERQREVVRGVLRSVFPAWFPAFYRMLFPPSKFSAEVNAFMCPPLFGWLVGKSELTEGVVDIKAAKEEEGPRQEVWRNTVKVERCRYLEASKCKGTCMNLCKLPTEAFFREDLGMPLRMTPNFEDLSCEFAFGQDALPAEEDPLMREPCWTECLSSDKQPKKPQRACHTMPESPLRGP
ncbi:unnamed protein product [Ectocarpus sp. 12 AP-2014]